VPEQNSKRRFSFASNLLTILGGQAACAGLGIGIEILYARLLGAEGRGQIGLCLMAIAAFAMVGGLGVETPALIWAADRKRQASDWVPGVSLCGLVGSTIAVCLWAVIYWRWHPAFLKGITPSMALLVLATLPCATFFGYLMAIISGLERFGLRARVALVDQTVGLLAFSALVLLYGRNAELAIVANLLAMILSIGICMFSVRDFLKVRPLAVSTGNQVRDALGFGLPGIMGNLASFFNYRLDVFVVNYFLSPAAVGIYGLGVVVSEALWQIPSAAALALFPRTARTTSEDATEFTCLVIRQVFVVACITGAAVAIASPLLIPLVFGEQFAPSVSVIWWILPGTVTLSVAKIMCADLAGRKKPQYASVFAFFSLLLTVCLDFTLIPRMGINGAAIASSASYIFNSVLLAIVLKRELKVSWKSIFVPRSAEWVFYRQIWSRYRSRLVAPGVANASSKLNQNQIS
jgi:O-antigen/teichoic acid export membrane protein